LFLVAAAVSGPLTASGGTVSSDSSVRPVLGAEKDPLCVTTDSEYGYGNDVSFREALQYALLHPDYRRADGSRAITFSPDLLDRPELELELTRMLTDQAMSGELPKDLVDIVIAGPSDGSCVVKILANVYDGMFVYLSDIPINLTVSNLVFVCTSSSSTKFLQLKKAGEVRFVNCEVRDFRGSGGAVAEVNDGQFFSVRGCRFVNNSGGYGTIQVRSSLEAVSTVFEGNCGGIYVRSRDKRDLSVDVSRCVFLNNKDSSQIGAVRVDGYSDGATAAARIVSSSFVGNSLSAAVEGAAAHAIYLSNVNTSVVDMCTFIGNGNQTDLRRSVVVVRSGNDVSVIGCTFRGNYATSDGMMLLSCPKISLANVLAAGNTQPDLILYSDSVSARQVSIGSIGYGPSDNINTGLTDDVFSRKAGDPLQKTEGDFGQYYEPIVRKLTTESQFMGVQIWHDAQYENIAYKTSSSPLKLPLRGSPELANIHVTTDITLALCDKDNPLIGSRWLNLSAALEVTTLEDVVDGTDGLLSLREACLKAASETNLVSGGSVSVVFVDELFEQSNVITCRWAQTQIEVKNQSYPLTVESPEGRTVVLDGADKFRHFRIWPGNRLNLKGVRLQRALGSSYGDPYPGTDGGSILNLGTLHAVNCVFADNRAGGRYLPKMGIEELSGSGGAIYAAEGSETVVRQCSFSGNRAAKGGAIAGSGRQTVVATTFSENRAGCGTAGGSLGQGGACAVSGSDAAYLHCTIVGNDVGASGAGGGFFADTGTDDTKTPIHLVDTIVIGNTAGSDVNDLHAQGRGAIDVAHVFCGQTNGQALAWTYAALSKFDRQPLHVLAGGTTTGAQPSYQASALRHVYYPVLSARLNDSAAIGVDGSENYEKIYFKGASGSWLPIRGPGGRFTPQANALKPENSDQFGTTRVTFLGAVVKTANDALDPLDESIADAYDVTDITWQGFADAVARLERSGPKKDVTIRFPEDSAGTKLVATFTVTLSAFTNFPLTVEGPVEFDGNSAMRFFAMEPNNRAIFRGVTFSNGGNASLDIGGAIWGQDGCRVTAENCVFSNNAAQWGGAIGMDGQTVLKFMQTDFSGNRANNSDQGNDVFQDRGTIDVAGGMFNPTNFVNYSNPASQPLSLMVPYALSTVSGVSGSTSLSGVRELLAAGVPVTTVSGADGAALSANDVAELSAAVSSAYEAKPWFSVVSDAGIVKAVLNETATPTTDCFSVSSGVSLEVSVMPSNVKPNLWYALECAESPVGPYVTVAESWVQADGEGRLERPIIAPAKGTAGFYRVVTRVERSE